MSSGLAIAKMSGAGNDFIVIRGQDADALGPDLGAWIRAVTRRGISVGADGVLAVEPLGPDRARVRYWNADGSEAFCGNGTRCAARFAQREGWVGKSFTLETLVGEVPAEVVSGRVRIVLPPAEDRGEISVEAAGETHRGRFVVAGVPHFVRRVDDVSEAPLERWGPELRRHAAFGAVGTNVDVVSLDASGVHRIRTWERGVENETLSCGTGAIAAALAVHGAIGADTMTVVPASGVGLEVRLIRRRDTLAGVELVGDARFVLYGTVEPEAVLR
jgi:diaminopimelate epimerase